MENQTNVTETYNLSIIDGYWGMSATTRKTHIQRGVISPDGLAICNSHDDAAGWFRAYGGNNEKALNLPKVLDYDWENQTLTTPVVGEGISPSTHNIHVGYVLADGVVSCAVLAYYVPKSVDLPEKGYLGYFTQRMDRLPERKNVTLEAHSHSDKVLWIVDGVPIVIMHPPAAGGMLSEDYILTYNPLDEVDIIDDGFFSQVSNGPASVAIHCVE